MSQQSTFSMQLDNQELLGRLLTDYSDYTFSYLLLVNIKQQRLYSFNTQTTDCESYFISSAANGIGSQNGSGKTPLGAHYIRDKFGEDAPLGSIFKGRQKTGKTAKILTKPNELSDADNITSRILWLSGLEDSFNKGGDVDSYSRYIYIHGTDEEGRLGTPASHGCIRMSNQSVIELFDLVPTNTLVYILAS